MKKRHTKLRLNRETLRRLTRDDLEHVVGENAISLLLTCLCTGESFYVCRITDSICKYETCDC